MPPRRAAPPASPAMSTRSARAQSRRLNGHGDDDDDAHWDGQSMISNTSHKVASKRSGKSNGMLGLTGTSVNIANAFSSATHPDSHNMPTPSSSVPRRSAAPASRRARPAPTTPSSMQDDDRDRERLHTPSTPRATSPVANALRGAARALSPVRYFLQPRSTDDADVSAEYASFSSYREGDSGLSSKYSYNQEEEFVELQKKKAIEAKRRKARVDGDMPYRPVEDDETYGDSDSSEGGEGGVGVVSNGALAGRAGTRGRRSDLGKDGYLGMGLGLQPRRRKEGKGDRGMETDEGIGPSEEDDREKERQQRAYSRSPLPETPFGRSPTPGGSLQVGNPRMLTRPVPMPVSARRQPSQGRTVITNVLHGVAEALRAVVAFFQSLLRAVLSPFTSRGKHSRTIRRNWWRSILGLVALSLAARFAFRPRAEAFRAPDLPPSSVDELVARLTSIENAMAKVANANSALERDNAEGRKHNEGLRGRIGDLEAALKAEERRVLDLAATSDKGNKALQSSAAASKADADRLSGRMSSVEKEVSDVSTRVQKLLEAEGWTKREIKQIKDRVEVVERDVATALDDGRLTMMLNRLLPAGLPMAKGSRGDDADIDQRLWTELRQVFLSKDEANEAVRKAMENSGRAGRGREGLGKEVEEWGERLYERLMNDGGWQSARQEVVAIVEGKVEELRSSIEEVRRLQAARAVAEESANKGKGKGKGAATQGTVVQVKNARGEEITSALQQLIDAAILRYSKDVIARPDYALFTAGARVVPAITSDTLVIQPKSSWARTLWGAKPAEGLPPAVALTPDGNVGKCWPFRGAEGQLGVMLSNRTVVGAVTVEHASKEVAMDVSSAPREIEVWGIVDQDDDLAKVERHVQMYPPPETASMPPSPKYLLLTTLTYDTTSVNNVQSFGIPQVIQDLEIAMGVVIFKIRGNWGADYTCVYRVRVHGPEVEDEWA